MDNSIVEKLLLLLIGGGVTVGIFFIKYVIGHSDSTDREIFQEIKDFKGNCHAQHMDIAKTQTQVSETLARVSLSQEVMQERLREDREEAMATFASFRQDINHVDNRVKKLETLAQRSTDDGR